VIISRSHGWRPSAAGRSPAAVAGTVLFSIAWLAGCTPSGTSQPPPVETLHLAEYRITPSQLSLDAGSYTFSAVNDGSINHALELTGNGVDGETPDLAFEPGHAEGFTVTLKPGTYQFFCPVDGHRGLGMQGTLVVH
jgi:plastocyanin